MFNFADMFGKLNELQNRMKDVRAQLENVIVEAEAGGGMVRVKANANRRILKISIDPTIVDKNDTELLGDVITAAVNKALEAADARSQTEVQAATKGILPNIPGLDKLGLG
jgi:hypothetical protein